MSKSSITIDKKPGFPPVHPGEILADELAELGLSSNKLANALNVPANRISEIVAGKRAVTADTALRLGQYFGTGPLVWLNLQTNYDLAVAQAESGKMIEKTVKQRKAA
ncbi:MAG: HigA family addiction module antidote protein [Alphaproteobacteria bacterium]|nr:HigA family addiction module antidote protein [Alphaproteobacteria bacterium]